MAADPKNDMVVNAISLQKHGLYFHSPKHPGYDRLSDLPIIGISDWPIIGRYDIGNKPLISVNRPISLYRPITTSIGR